MRFRCCLIVLMLLIPAATSFSQPKKLTLAQAVQAAERFIQRNGYTDLAPMKETSKLALESIEWTSDKKRILKQRHNTLERKAYGYARGTRWNKSGWTVVFRHIESDYADPKNGRGVTMDAYGRNMRVEHVDALLKAFTPFKRRTTR